jgi:hypothetical protein
MIRINGTVLASLLYECASGKGDIVNRKNKRGR